MKISFSVEITRGFNPKKQAEQLTRAMDQALEASEITLAKPIGPVWAQEYPNNPIDAELATDGAPQPRQPYPAGSIGTSLEPADNPPKVTHIPVKDGDEVHERRRQAGLKAAETRKVNQLKKEEAAKREARRNKRAATIAAKTNTQ